MTASVSLLHPQTGVELPPAYSDELTAQEQALITGLAAKLTTQATFMEISGAYYDGMQRLQNLGISIPQTLASIRTVVDWPRICVDPLVQRCVVDGFRLPNATDVDEDLAAFWQANDLDYEAPLGFLDSLMYGRSYMIVGSRDNDTVPLITVESPLNMSVKWDPRTRRVVCAYQSYQVEGDFQAALYLPDQTIQMSKDNTTGTWSVDDRDQHGMGEVPVVRFPNRARTADREGRSEITPAVRNTTDSACRSLLGMEIAREFYSIPHRYVLGVQEGDFVNPDGTVKTAIEMTMSKFLAFERDEDGNLPTVGQFQAFDPSVFTKIIDTHAQLMASYTQFPPQWFGETSTANPASADAIRVSHDGVDRRAQQVQRQFSDPLEQVMRLAWRFANNADQVPEEMQRLETDWVRPGIRLEAADTDAATKQVAAGMVPPTSDVVLRRVGYGAVERQQLEADRRLDQGQQVLAELAHSLEAKDARTDLAVTRDIQGGTGDQPQQPPRQ